VFPALTKDNLQNKHKRDDVALKMHRRAIPLALSYPSVDASFCGNDANERRCNSLYLVLLVMIRPSCNLLREKIALKRWVVGNLWKQTQQNGCFLFSLKNA